MMDAPDITRRRNVASQAEKPLSPAQGGQPEALGPSDTSPAVPTSVVYTLLGFTLAMIVVPIGSYFATLRLIFKGNSTYAGGFAALMANVVLVGFVIVAMREEDQEKTAAVEAASSRERRRSGGGRGVVDVKKGQ